jgi:hypothetical protein
VLKMRKVILALVLAVMPMAGSAATLPINGIIGPGDQCGLGGQGYLCLTDDGRYAYDSSGLFSQQGHGPRLDLNIGIAIASDLRESTIRPVDGMRFNAWGLHVAEGAARFQQTGSEPAPKDRVEFVAWAQSDVAYSGFSVAGYRGSHLVGFTEVLQPGAFRLDLGWRDLDRLSLRLLYPENYRGAGIPLNEFDWLFGTVSSNEAWCNQNCGISVSGFDLAPIPLPPAAALLLGGLAALGFMGWRRRS